MQLKCLGSPLLLNLSSLLNLISHAIVCHVTHDKMCVFENYVITNKRRVDDETSTYSS